MAFRQQAPLVYTPLSEDLLAMGADLEALGGGDARVGRLEVFCRFRPLPPETDTCLVAIDKDSFSIRDPRCPADVPAGQAIRRFKIPHVLPWTASQQDVFDAMGSRAFQWFMEGFNCSIIGMGQSGAGKTHTIMGVGGVAGKADDGLLHLTLRKLFEAVAAMEAQSQVCHVGLSYWEVNHSEAIDLLRSPGTGADGLAATLPGARKQFVIVRVTSMQEAEAVLQQCREDSPNWAPALPKGSPRAALPNSTHAFVRIVLFNDTLKRVSSLHFIDLAGSQALANHSHHLPSRHSVAPAGVPLLAAAQQWQQHHRGLVRQQLLALNRVIGELAARAEAQQLQEQQWEGRAGALAATLPGGPAMGPIVSARTTRLTQVLAPLLAGNCKTFLLLALSPAAGDYLDTAHAARLGQRARAIATPCMRGALAGNAGLTLDDVDMQPLPQVLSWLRARAMDKQQQQRQLQLQQEQARAGTAARQAWQGGEEQQSLSSGTAMLLGLQNGVRGTGGEVSRNLSTGGEGMDRRSAGGSYPRQTGRHGQSLDGETSQRHGREDANGWLHARDVHEGSVDASRADRQQAWDTVAGGAAYRTPRASSDFWSSIQSCVDAVQESVVGKLTDDPEGSSHDVAGEGPAARSADVAQPAAGSNASVWNRGGEAIGGGSQRGSRAAGDTGDQRADGYGAPAASKQTRAPRMSADILRQWASPTGNDGPGSPLDAWGDGDWLSAGGGHSTVEEAALMRHEQGGGAVQGLGADITSTGVRSMSDGGAGGAQANKKAGGALLNGGVEPADASRDAYGAGRDGSDRAGRSAVGNMAVEAQRAGVDRSQANASYPVATARENFAIGSSHGRGSEASSWRDDSGLPDRGRALQMLAEGSLGLGTPSPLANRGGRPGSAGITGGPRAGDVGQQAEPLLEVSSELQRLKAEFQEIYRATVQLDSDCSMSSMASAGRHLAAGATPAGVPRAPPSSATRTQMGGYMGAGHWAGGIDDRDGVDGSEGAFGRVLVEQRPDPEEPRLGWGEPWGAARDGGRSGRSQTDGSASRKEGMPRAVDDSLEKRWEAIRGQAREVDGEAEKHAQGGGEEGNGDGPPSPSRWDLDLSATALSEGPSAMETELKEELDEANSQLGSLKKNYDAVLAVLQRDKRKCQAATERVTELERDMMEAAASYEVQLDNLRIENLSLRSKVRYLEGESQFSDLFERYEQEVSALTAEVLSLRAETHSLQCRLLFGTADTADGDDAAKGSDNHHRDSSRDKGMSMSLTIAGQPDAGNVAKGWHSDTQSPYPPRPGSAATPLSAPQGTGAAGPVPGAAPRTRREESEGRQMLLLRRSLKKLQAENQAMADELAGLKRRERHFELHQRSAEDYTRRANKLQRELAGKDEEVLAVGIKAADAFAKQDAAELALQEARKREEVAIKEKGRLQAQVEELSRELYLVRQEKRKGLVLAKIANAAVHNGSGMARKLWGRPISTVALDIVQKLRREIHPSSRLDALMEKLLKEVLALVDELRSSREREQALLDLLTSSSPRGASAQENRTVSTSK
eukprot:jgi/Mesvir1/19509/Mv16606-RA.1